MKTTMKHCASLLLAIATIATLVSCSNENDVSDGDRLPDGKYPVTFTATGLEIAPTTRATADGTWAVGEEVAVMIGDYVKKYTTKNSGNTATLESANADNKFYWESKRDIYVSAWYPYSDNRPTNFTVQGAQDDTDGYQKSDFLYAYQKVSFGSEAGLTFKHLTAKVEINLKAGDGVTTTEVAGANVTLVKQATTSGTITYDGTTEAATVAQSDGGTDVVTPKTMVAKANYQKTVQALVVPQQMKGKQFIKVTIGNGAAERNYYYTPANDDANLQSGNQYTYDITVTNGYLEVTMAGESGAWGDTGTGSETVTGKVVETGYTADDIKPGDYLYTDGTTSDGGLRARYADGTVKWAETKPIPETGKTLAAIVFWTPKETNSTGRTTPASLTDDKIMATAFPNCNHGLAVALQDVSISMQWQSTIPNLSEEPTEPTNVSRFQKTDNFKHANKTDFVSIDSDTGITDAINKIYGYQNTQVLLAYNVYCTNNNNADYIVNPVNALSDFSSKNPAPPKSTGWFFPSVKELHMLCYKDVDDVYNASDLSFTTTRDIVNNSLKAAGCETLGTSYYWSSSETTNFATNRAYSVNFSDSGVFKSNNKTGEFGVRAVCAF